MTTKDPVRSTGRGFGSGAVKPGLLIEVLARKPQVDRDAGIDEIRFAERIVVGQLNAIFKSTQLIVSFISAMEFDNSFPSICSFAPYVLVNLCSSSGITIAPPSNLLVYPAAACGIW